LIEVVLFFGKKMRELILSGVTAFLVAARWFLMLTIKQNNNKKINFPLFPALNILQKP